MKKVLCAILGTVALACIVAYRYVLLTYPTQLIKDDFDFSIPHKTYTPLQNVDMKGCTAYLYIDRSDLFEAPAALREAQCWKTTDSEKLERLKSLFKFTSTGGEFGTCASRFILKRGFTTIYDTEIVLTNGYFVVESGSGDSQFLEETKNLFKSFTPSSERFLFDF